MNDFLSALWTEKPMIERDYNVQDTDNIKRLRLLDPQGEPDVIECDGMEYVRTGLDTEERRKVLFNLERLALNNTYSPFEQLELISEAVGCDTDRLAERLYELIDVSKFSEEHNPV